MRSCLFAACLIVLAVPTRAHAQASGTCTDPWTGIQKMTGTFTITGGGSGAIPNGTFSMMQNITGSPDLTMMMAFPGTPPAGVGLEYGNVNYNVTTTDQTGTTSSIANGPALNAMGTAAQGYLTFDPVGCTYTFTIDPWVEMTNTDTSGNMTMALAPFGPPGGLNATMQPLPLSGTTLAGSATYDDTTSYPVPLHFTMNWQLDGVQNCKVTLPQIYAQAAQPWGPEQYDHSYDSDPSIGRWGCAMTSMDMGMIFAGWSGYSGDGATAPDRVNTLMQQLDDFGSSGGVLFDKATRDLSQGKLKFDASMGYRRASLAAILANAELDDVLCAMDPHPVVVGVKLGPVTLKSGITVIVPHHYVLVVEKRGSDYMVADPAGGRIHPLSDFGDFETRGFIKDPPGDLSGLDIEIGDNATFMVSDPTGNQSGLSNSGDFTQNIPRSAAGADAFTDDIDGTMEKPPSFYMQMFQPVVGDYRVDVLGVADGPFELIVAGFTQSAAGQPIVKIDGTAQAGVTTTYYVHYNSADGSMTTVDQTPAAGGDTTMDSHGHSGCGCQSGGDAGSCAMLGGVALFALRRRRRR